MYTNLLSALLLVAIAPLAEAQTVTGLIVAGVGVRSQLILLLSCAVGTAISYFAFLCRSLVSATSFGIIGDVCKCAPQSGTSINTALQAHFPTSQCLLNVHPACAGL